MVLIFYLSVPCKLLVNMIEILEKDKKNSYVIISKVKSGNIKVKPIPLNPITIRDRFRKLIN